ncbi:MAG TPA: 3-phosphoshikimate 1-carboxyvinyltransferase [Propionibacteriaceae bacterium]|nr:3-phosphoshikimate 1-carboxyvinyltransferase [Propionibacteriaceae bacterium]
MSEPAPLSWAAPVAAGPLRARVVVPGSKSATARALLLAAIADGPGTITGPLEARDSQLMRDALRALGATIDDTDPLTWTVLPASPVTAAQEIDCGLAGTVMRFVPPVAALAPGTTRFTGDEQATARPVHPVLDGLRQLGAVVEGDELPFSVTGPVRGGTAVVDATGSSQFVSGLLLTGARFPEGLTLRHDGDGPVPSMRHIEMTVDWLRARGVRVDRPDEETWVVWPGPIRAISETVEPDFMTAAPFLAAALVTGGTVTVAGWPMSSTQPGADLGDVLSEFGASATLDADGLTVSGAGRIHGVDLDLHDASELVPVAAALAALAVTPSTIRGVAHIRGHETDRLAALAAEITGLGGSCVETADGLDITPAPLHGGTFHCYADHRLAHAGAVLGLVQPGVVLDDIACTSKTMPRFPETWQGMLR